MIYLLQEIVIMIRIGYTEEKKGKERLVDKAQRIFNFNSFVALGLALVLFFYNILLIYGFFWVELIVPFINLLSWIKLI